MVATKHRFSAKKLQREFGVTYKTAWRMAHLISRQLLNSGTSSGRSETVDVETGSSAAVENQQQLGGHKRSSPAA
jgi:hypothetical protein